MKRIFVKWILVSFAVAAVVVAATVLPAGADRPTKRVGSEVAVSGLTVPEQAALQRDLQAELTPLIPAGVGNNPVRVDITQRDRDDLAAPVVTGQAPLRVGVVKPVAGGVGKRGGQAFNCGAVEENPDGSFVWAVAVTSPGAQAIRVHFTAFSLPDNTKMYFLSPDGQADGPYVGTGRNGNGDFWTRSIASETGTIVLRYSGSTPDVDRPKISFVISDVGHIHGRPPRPQEQSGTWPCSGNAVCLVDASCVNTEPAALAEDAVAKMEWIQGPYIYSCTGGLLADTDTATQIPYFLTANHCLSTSNSNLETFFNYTTASCDGTCPDSVVTGGTPPPASTVGVTLVATGTAGDFTLFTLNQAPPAGATFLGWNNAPIATTNGAYLYRVSNPNFGPQVYSEHQVTTSSPTCTGWPRGQRIYSVDQVGATQGGSSGSPVLNSAGEVVGQLSGCCGYDCSNVCDSANNWTVDGALAYYWNSVSQFLDPQGGCTGDAQCNDGLYCTGTETCVGGACQSSGNPCDAGTVCNEATDTCDSPSSCGNGSCEAGEDCNTCPSDCRAKLNGNPNSRYCCNGNDPNDCGNPQCSQSGFSCGGGGGGGGGCTTNADCDDGQFCNGAETCMSGSCQSGSDPCPGQGCDETTDVCISCGLNKDRCSKNSDCCSNNCKNGTCKGN